MFFEKPLPFIEKFLDALNDAIGEYKAGAYGVSPCWQMLEGNAPAAKQYEAYRALKKILSPDDADVVGWSDKNLNWKVGFRV